MKPDNLDATIYPNTSMRIMRTVLEEEGLDWQSLASQAGVEASVFEDLDAKVSGIQEIRFQQLFADATAHISGCWFQTGLRYRLMSYGPLGMAVLAADTLEQGLGVLMAFQELTPSLMSYSLIYEGEELIALQGDDEDAPLALRNFCQVRALGSATMFLEDMQPGGHLLDHIETRVAKPEGWDKFAQLIDVPVHFGEEHTRWVFAKGAGKMPLAMASPVLEETYQRICKELIEEARVNDRLVDKVYSMLVRSSREFPNAFEAAASLNMSERSFHRHLSSNNTSYGTILDDVKAQRATYLLENLNLSIQQISDILGFSETSSFTRAFKRWRGVSPSQYRKQ